MRQVTPPDLEVPTKASQQSFDFTAPPNVPTRSPGPSRAMYRLTRTWKKTWVRKAVLVGLPLAVVTALGVRVALHPDVHAFVAKQRAAVMEQLSTRPEFAIRGARVIGATPKLTEAIRTVVAVPEGASTLNFDVAGAQEAVNAMPAVRNARVTLAADGMLDIHVDERHPRALWRDGEGRLWLVDGEGVTVGPALARRDHPRLPLVLGQSANEAVEEALALIQAAPDLTPRIRALVRVGARRWNVALDRELTILLPEQDAAGALARVMAWHYGEKVLDRGLSHIDMRLADRPTLRLTPRALELSPLNKKLDDGTGEET